MNAIKTLALAILATLFMNSSALGQAGHTQKIAALTFNSDGNLLLSVSPDGVIILWGETGEKLKIIKPEQSIYNRNLPDIFTKLAFYNNGKNFIAGALSHAYWGETEVGSVQLLDLKHAIGPSGIDISGDGQYLYCNDMFSGPGIEVRYATGSEKGAVMKSINEKGTFDVVAIKGIPDRFVCSGQLSGVKVMDINGKVYAHLPSLTGMGSLAVTDKGEYLMKGSSLYNLSTQKKMVTLDIQSRISDVKFIGDSKIITSHDKEVNIWDFSGKRLQTIKHDRLVTQVAVSPEGKLLVFGDEIGQLKMYTVSGQFIQDYK